jgi:metal-dependent amidase/aminoacylase/carboxypeptidase family protein
MSVEHSVDLCSDMHITALLAAAETLVKAKDAWSGTLILVFQPAEEKGKGAQAMVDDGLYSKVPEPDVVIGAHVMPEKAGVIGTKHGLIASSADSYL